MCLSGFKSEGQSSCVIKKLYYVKYAHKYKFKSENLLSDKEKCFPKALYICKVFSLTRNKK